MFPTNYENVNNLINELLNRLKEILGDKLLGVYLTGSLVWGDFDASTSDVDLVAILSSEIDKTEFENLRKMHQDIVNKFKEWDDRVDVVYVSKSLINNSFSKTKDYLVKISSGEALNRREFKIDWKMNWYLVREKGIAVFGPDPKTLVEPISKEEFIEVVKTHAKNWVEYIKDTQHSRPSQAYGILTLCRALYAINNGEQVSKKKAASWMMEKFPEWSNLVNDALNWRTDYRNEKVNAEETYAEVVKFVDFAISKIS